MLLLSGNKGKKYFFITLPGWHCLGGVKGEIETPSGVKDSEWKEKLASSADLQGLLKAHNVTAFIANVSNEAVEFSCLFSQATTWLTFHVEVYRGFGGLLLNAPFRTLDTMGCCPTRCPSTFS